MKFGDCLNKRVDMSKVKLDVLRPWISQKITDILHIEDDVVVEFVYNQLEEEKFPCPKKMQINMTGFLNGKNARMFMDELWALLLSAQESENGIPAEFIQMKKDEILKREEDNNNRNNRSRSRSQSRTRNRAPSSSPELPSRSLKHDRFDKKEKGKEELTERKDKNDTNDANNKENPSDNPKEKAKDVEKVNDKDTKDRSRERKKSPEKTKIRGKSREKSRDRDKERVRNKSRERSR
jgi:serine/arginine repetitive matrix protein 1